MSLRILKINKLLKKELGQIFQKEAFFKDCLISISHLETSPDLRQTRIYLSIFPADKSDEIIKLIKKEEVHIQQKLHRRLYMKPLPKINFVIDNSQQKSAHIEKILKEEKSDQGR